MTDRPLTLPLASSTASLACAGGKGASLAKLATAGFAVPHGFIVSTAAYERFVRVNDLQDAILQILADVAARPSCLFERAAVSIRTLFEATALPSEIADAIRQAYDELGEHHPAVAVRSSATAEDLPGLSIRRSARHLPERPRSSGTNRRRSALLGVSLDGTRDWLS